MINKELIKEKANELNIPFKNLLAGVVCENIIEIITSGTYCNELYLCNKDDFSIEAYKKTSPNNIFYEYSREIDKKLESLYIRDILKDIISKAAESSMAIEGHVEENILTLEVIVDSMYIPVRLYFADALNGTKSSEMEDFDLTLTEKKIKILTSSKEELLIKNLFEIIQKLELINNMDCYYDTYNILTKYPINGRKIKDGLELAIKEAGIEISDKRIRAIAGYETYSYMKKKWKVELRQKKTSQPSWQDVIQCLNKFLGPIWESMEKNMVFLGDWMPQIKRFLD